MRTKIYMQYLMKFALRIVIFLVILAGYITNKELMMSFMTHEFTFGISEYGISIFHVLWAMFMFMMLRHIFPSLKLTMAINKAKEERYSPTNTSDELTLLRFVQRANQRAWVVLLIWLSFNAIWGTLYCFDFIDEADLLMITVFYFLGDYICILVFCPFQTFIMKNKCCVNCRIYEWGHFMMFTPLLFIRNFFSWSLFFTSLIVVLHWEIVYALHPERFYEGTNKNLQCAHCRDRTCQLKKSVLRQYRERKLLENK